MEIRIVKMVSWLALAAGVLLSLHGFSNRFDGEVAKAVISVGGLLAAAIALVALALAEIGDRNK
jgi:hypothetical protein